MTGDLVKAIVIENDGEYREIDWPERKPLEELSSTEILEMIKNAGIVGMGGAGFPTHVTVSYTHLDVYKRQVTYMGYC